MFDFPVTEGVTCFHGRHFWLAIGKQFVFMSVFHFVGPRDLGPMDTVLNPSLKIIMIAVLFKNWKMSQTEIQTSFREKKHLDYEKDYDLWSCDILDIFMIFIIFLILNHFTDQIKIRIIQITNLVTSLLVILDHDLSDLSDWKVIMILFMSDHQWNNTVR